MRSYIGAGGSGSAKAQQAEKLIAEREARKLAYAPFKNAEAPPEVVSELASALQAAPESANVINRTMAALKSNPLVRIEQNGQISFSRVPTISEAELVRRTIDGNVSSLYRDPINATTASALKGVETSLRQKLDDFVPTLKGVRTDVSAQKSAEEAFKAGEKSIGADANQVLVDLQDIMSNPEALASFKQGFLAKIERLSLTGQRDSIIAKLADVDGKGSAENLILSTILSPDEASAVLKKLAVASESSAASKYVLGQSATAGTQSAERRIGSEIGASDVIDAATSMSPMAAISLVQKMVASVPSELTDAQRSKVVELLISEYPDIVRKALTDKSGAARLAQIVTTVGNKMNQGSQGAVATGAGLLGGTIASKTGLPLYFNSPNDANQ